MKLKKGDKVKVIAGKDRGREGKIEKLYKKQNTVMISGLNIYKKHIKKSDKVPEGGVVELPRPLNVSKVAFVCPKCGKPTRVGFKVQKNGKVRFCKKCRASFK